MNRFVLSAPAVLKDRSQLTLQLPHPDVDGNVYDPQMRQKYADGSRVVSLRADAPKSTYLQRLRQGVAPVLPRLDAQLKLLDLSTWRRASVEKAVDVAISSAEETQSIRELLVKLALLLMKRRAKDGQVTASTLWRQILARTDEIYEVVEQLQPIFLLLMREVLSRLKLDPDAILFEIPGKSPVRTLMAGQLKDPVMRRHPD